MLHCLESGVFPLYCVSSLFLTTEICTIGRIVVGMSWAPITLYLFHTIIMIDVEQETSLYEQDSGVELVTLCDFCF